MKTLLPCLLFFASGLFYGLNMPHRWRFIAMFWSLAITLISLGVLIAPFFS